MTLLSSSALLGGFFFLVTANQAVSACSCAPLLYRFRLNLDADCRGSTTFNKASGIAAVSCGVSALNPISRDYTPVTVEEVQVLELDSQQQIIREQSHVGKFVDGDTIGYESVLNFEEASSVVPTSLSLILSGVNSRNEPVVNKWSIEFDESSLCAQRPLLQEGDQIGWTVLVR